MINTDVKNHVQGKSLFIDDIIIPEGTLYASVCVSQKAHAKITKIDLAEAIKLDGVINIFTSADIPGENQVGGIIQDETLLAKDEVHFIGEPIALVIAESD